MPLIPRKPSPDHRAARRTRAADAFTAAATAAVLVLATLPACATYRPSRIRMGDMAETGWTATRYFPVNESAIEPSWMRGEASWYGSRHQGRRTATGESFNMYRFTAAHKNLPFNTVVRVIREDTGASVLVRINDRGPYSEGRIIDLSFAAAHVLRSVSEGVVDVRLEVVEWGDGAVYEDR